MKKIISLVLIGILCLGIVGCGSKEEEIEAYKTAPVQNNGNEIGEIIEVDIELFNELIESDNVVVFYVGRPTCPACADFYPKLEAFAEENKFDIYHTNTDALKASDVDKVFNTLSKVQYTPTLLIWYKGEQIDLLVGSKSKGVIAEFLADIMD